MVRKAVFHSLGNVSWCNTSLAVLISEQTQSMVCLKIEGAKNRCGITTGNKNDAIDDKGDMAV